MLDESGRNPRAQSVIRSPGAGQRIPLGKAGVVTLKVGGGELGGTLSTFWNESEAPCAVYPGRIEHYVEAVTAVTAVTATAVAMPGMPRRR